MALSFANDIRPLFRDTPDVDTMKNFGMDLSSYDDVKKHADAIYERLDDGRCPATNRGPKNKSPGSNSGWTTAWRRKLPLTTEARSSRRRPGKSKNYAPSVCRR